MSDDPFEGSGGGMSQPLGPEPKPMTVAELIASLSLAPPQTNVLVWSDHDCEYVPIVSVVIMREEYRDAVFLETLNDTDDEGEQ